MYKMPNNPSISRGNAKWLSNSCCPARAFPPHKDQRQGQSAKPSARSDLIFIPPAASI